VKIFLSQNVFLSIYHFFLSPFFFFLSCNVYNIIDDFQFFTIVNYSFVGIDIEDRADFGL
jgi:hypothetical protein